MTLLSSETRFTHKGKLFMLYLSFDPLKEVYTGELFYIRRTLKIMFSSELIEDSNNLFNHIESKCDELYSTEIVNEN